MRNGRLYRESVVSLRGDQSITGGKGNLRDDGTRVPLLVRWPGVTPAGREVNALVDSSDFLPTLLELAGVPLPSDIKLDGHSFAPLLKDQPGRQRTWCYAGLRNRHWVRTQRFKLYQAGQFYDLAEDVNEQHSLQKETAAGAAKAALQLLRGALAGLPLKR